jgi:hypothetical protein
MSGERRHPGPRLTRDPPGRTNGTAQPGRADIRLLLAGSRRPSGGLKEPLPLQPTSISTSPRVPLLSNRHRAAALLPCPSPQLSLLRAQAPWYWFGVELLYTLHGEKKGSAQAAGYPHHDFPARMRALPWLGTGQHLICSRWLGWWWWCVCARACVCVSCVCHVCVCVCVPCVCVCYVCVCWDVCHVCVCLSRCE